MPAMPDFKTDEEFAEFTDTHDMADYWDELEPVDDIRINRSTLRRKWIASSLSDSTLEKIYRIANERNLSAAALIQQWIEERIALEEVAQ
jgi:hypothetical protein